MSAQEKKQSSNTAPLLAACTFLLGCLVAMVAMAQFNNPVSAQDASPTLPDSSIKVSALAATSQSGGDFLVVFKEEEALVGPKKGQPVQVMCVYFIDGNGKRAAIHLLGTRLVDYDFQIQGFETDKSNMPLKDVLEALEDIKKRAARDD